MHVWNRSKRDSLQPIKECTNLNLKNTSWKLYFSHSQNMFSYFHIWKFLHFPVFKGNRLECSNKTFSFNNYQISPKIHYVCTITCPVKIQYCIILYIKFFLMFLKASVMATLSRFNYIFKPRKIKNVWKKDCELQIQNLYILTTNKSIRNKENKQTIINIYIRTFLWLQSVYFKNLASHLNVREMENNNKKLGCRNALTIDLQDTHSAGWRSR